METIKANILDFHSENTLEVSRLNIQDFAHQEKIGDFTCYALATYYPADRFSEVVLESNDRVFRNIISEFKNGEKEEITTYLASALSKCILNREIISTPTQTAICTIPMSNNKETKKRLEKLTSELSSKLNVLNGFEYISSIEREQSSQVPQDYEEDILEYIKFNESALVGKDIILFDDIMTTEKNFLLVANRLKKIGVHNVTGIFLGKTYSIEEHPSTTEPKNVRTFIDNAAYVLSAIEEDKAQALATHAKFYMTKMYSERQSNGDDKVILLAKIFNNIVMRGTPTYPSLYLEEKILQRSNLTYKRKDEIDITYELMNYREELPKIDNYIFEIMRGRASMQNYLAIGILSAWLHRAMITAIIDGVFSDPTQWNIAIIERDIQFSEIAMTDMYIYMSQLAKLLDHRLPKINLTIYTQNADTSGTNDTGMTVIYKDSREYTANQASYHLVINIGMTDMNTNNAKEGTLRYSSDRPYILVTPQIENSESKIENTTNVKRLPRFYNFYPHRYFSTPDEYTAKDDALRFLLQNVFRKVEFRDGQLKIIKKILSLESVIGLLPTGSGKSLCYQLSGLLEPGTVIIIDPIKSLMVDQVENLHAIGINASNFVNSDLKFDQKEEILNQMVESNLKFIFISPERLQIKSFRRKMSAASNEIPIPFVVIDETHCVSEWGHDFRPAYLNIARNIRAITKSTKYTPPLIALTGTASYAVLNDVQHELEINSENARIYPKTFDREELNFTIIKTPQQPYSIISKKQETLLNILRNELPKKFQKSNINEMLSDSKISGIIFSSTVDGKTGVAEISKFLDNMNVQHGIFSGKKPKDKKFQSILNYEEYKTNVQKAFKKNKLSLLVATKAFGMGIDKPNIRYTIHYTLPSSLESFYQEAGRAGRDKKDANCYLIFSEFSQDYTNKVLDLTRSNSETSSDFSSIFNNVYDDISTQLFFHFNSFIGESQEILNTFNFLAQYIYPSMIKLKNNECGYLKLKILGGDKAGEQGTIFEKVLHRLLTLGVVEDYTVEYERNFGIFEKTYEIKVRKFNHSQIKSNLVRYLSRYSTQEQIKKYLQIQHQEFGTKTGENELIESKRYIVSLIQFIYDEIEKQRRRALATMVEVARNAQTSNEIKKYILNYFEESTFSKDLSKILRQFDTQEISKIISQILTEKDQEELRNLQGNVTRFLESSPDNPGLYLISALTRIKLKLNEPQNDADDQDYYIINDWSNFLAKVDKQEYSNFVDFVVNTTFSLIGDADELLKKNIYLKTLEYLYSEEFVRKYYNVDWEVSTGIIIKKITKKLSKILDIYGGK